MPTLALQRDIPAEPARVFDALLDADRYEQWVTGHDGWPAGVPELSLGATFRQRMKLMRRSAEMTWTVTEVLAPARIALSGQGPLGIESRTLYELSAHEGGTSVRLTSEFDGALVGGPLRAMMTRQIAAACEDSLSRLTAMIAVDPAPARPLGRVRRRRAARVPVPAPAPPPAPAPVRWPLPFADQLALSVGMVRLVVRIAQPSRAWRVASRLVRPRWPGSAARAGDRA
jgi:uncharacterized protein YndB with AHSA1/START domain